MEVTCTVSSLITQIIHSRKTTCLILCRYLSLVLSKHLWLVDSRPLNVFWRQQVIYLGWNHFFSNYQVIEVSHMMTWLKSCLAHSMQSLVAWKKAYSGWQWLLKVYGWWWWWCGTKIFQVVVFFSMFVSRYVNVLSGHPFRVVPHCCSQDVSRCAIFNFKVNLLHFEKHHTFHSLVWSITSI